MNKLRMGCKQMIDYEQCIMEDNDEEGEFFKGWKKVLEENKNG